MTTSQSYRVITDTDWQQLVTYAIIRTALNVYSESGATTGHAARASLATRVLNSPTGFTPIFSLHIGCDDTFLALTVPQGVGLSLAAAETRVSAVWNAVAGA